MKNMKNMTDWEKIERSGRSFQSYLGRRVGIGLLAATWLGNATLAAEENKPTNRPGSQQPRIIGGDPVDSSTYPWMVAIERVDRLGLSNGQFEAQICAGSVIAPRWILTAGHCLRRGSTTLWQADELKVLVGATDLIEDTGQLIDIDQIILHEGFNFSPTIVENDIALLKLATPVDVTPVMLNSDATNEEAGIEAITIGWGATNSQGTQFPPRLQQVSLPLVSNQDCADAFTQAEPPADILSQHICAGLLGEGGKDACTGDSGGPLFLSDAEGGANQLGITSFGVGCATPDFPGVYTRVSSFLDWIEQSILNTLYFSQAGKGESILRSDVVLFNQSPDRPASGEVFFWDKHGNPIDPAIFLGPGTLSPAGMQVPVTTAFELAPLGTVSFETDNLGELLEGSVTVVSDEQLSGVVHVTLNGGIAGVQASQPGRNFITPVRSQNGVRTGVAVRNTESAQLTVTLTLYDAEGQMLASRDEMLAVNARLARFADELFADQLTDGFRGTLTISSQQGDVAVIALELGNVAGEFAALPVSRIE